MKSFIAKLGFAKVPSNATVPDLPDDTNGPAEDVAPVVAKAEPEPVMPVAGVEEQKRIKHLLHIDSAALQLQTKPLTPLGERWLGSLVCFSQDDILQVRSAGEQGGCRDHAAGPAVIQAPHSGRAHPDQGH